MEIFRGYKVELDLNNKQRTLLLQCAGVARWAWNWGLGQRKQEYKNIGKSSNFVEQNRQLNALKKTTYPWLYNYSKCIPQEALRNLDRAYQNFFRCIKNGEKVGLPKFKSKKHNANSFRLTGSTIRVENRRIRLPRIGWLRLKECDYIPTEGIHILSATMSEKAGHWFVSVQCREEIEVTQAIGEPIGVDLGIKTLAVCSNGQQFENPKTLKKAQHKLKRLQRELARREKGSKNREKTRKKLAKAYYQISCIRRDILHKATSTIVAKTEPDKKRPGTIVIEDLNVAGMIKNHYLAQAISDVSWAEFRRQLEYKTLWAGEELIIADRFFPSSKLCRHCGYINSGLKLSNRVWVCNCGAVLDRDFNAAQNLKSLAVRRVPPELETLVSNACGEDIRPAVTSLATSVKQEPIIESKVRF